MFVFENVAEETLGGGRTERLASLCAVLRSELAAAIGTERMQLALSLLDSAMEGGNVENSLVRLLGEQLYVQFAGKLWQLKFAEDSLTLLATTSTP